MNNEEFERKIDFIVNQQAQFASDIQRLEQSQERTDHAIARTGQIVARLASATLDGFIEVDAKINTLVDSQMRTDESVRNLTAVVDRYFRERRNGT